MSLPKRMILLMGLDIGIVWMSIYVAYYFRFSGTIPPLYVSQMTMMMVVSAIAFMLSMTYFKLYNRIWEYASIGEMVSIFRAVTVGALASYSVTWLITGKPVPLPDAIRTAGA